MIFKKKPSTVLSRVPKKGTTGKRRVIIQVIIGLIVIFLVADKFLNPGAKDVAQEGLGQVIPKQKENKGPQQEQDQQEEAPPEQQEQQEQDQQEEAPPEQQEQQEQQEQDQQEEAPPEQQEQQEQDQQEEAPPEQQDQQEQDQQEEAPPEQQDQAQQDPSPEEQLSVTYLQVLEGIEIDPEKNYPPPNYLSKGKGLVYNCVKKHWACVDRESYFQCAKNQKSKRAKSRPPVCVIENIYFSHIHCAQRQLLKVNRGPIPQECTLSEP